MQKRLLCKSILYISTLLLLTLSLLPSVVHTQSLKPLQVCATVPDLGNLAQEIGGDQVKVTVFAKSQEDPHFIEAKPSFIKALSQADLFLQIGMELEVGYAPVLLQNARNSRVLIGAPGYVDCSKVITPMEVPTGIVDRSMGDVHPLGNPHYMLDPLNGIQVARLIRDRLIELRPEKKLFFEERYTMLYRKIGDALVGEKLARKYEFEKLTLLYEEGKLEPFLREQKEEGSLGGWLGMMLPYRVSKVIGDHNLWPYFARRFGILMIGFLEPKPGISPTTKHLQALVEQIKAEGVKVILSSPYFEIRYAQFVSKNTGAKIVSLAHQVGSRPGTDNYLSMIDYNVRQLVTAFSGKN
ncbi:MAG: metal ABC transporter substrate-binding protein [Thermodesulfobacteriota bacterium]|jgi:ABC-type Zn uptake system ZnuABC Zn-binding protein ZnuA